MAQENNNAAAQQPQRFVCTGDCKRCGSLQQWGFCASVHAYSNMKVLDKVMETLTSLQGRMDALQVTVGELAARIEAIQNSEAAVFDPSDETVGDPALFPREYGEPAEKAE